MERSRILIVDDVKKNIQVLASTLSDSYDIEYTTDGHDAINWLKLEPFDLILLDIMMPSIDGYEVCKKIREDLQLKDVPVIFITAKTDSESIVKGFQAGGQDYILKPFNAEELRERVKTHIELKKSKEKLNELNQGLEKQVAIKTKELQNAYEELELLDTAKDEFLDLLSHELRTPLNGIKGFTDILKENIKSETLSRYINLLERSTDRLARFTHSAGLITSLRTKNYKLELSPIKLVHFINEVIKPQFTDILTKMSINLKIDFDSEDITLEADEKLLKEAFCQVIKNAIHFSPENSTIKVNIFDNGQSTSITVKDEGKGFSPEARDKIFKPFGYGERHIDQNIGLGLHLVKLVVEAHNAEIKVGNPEGGGALVNLIFPKT